MRKRDPGHIYLEVIDDLRQSEFAKRRKLTVMPAPYHLGEIRLIVEKLPKGGTFLDIGTGMGIVPEVMLRLGYEVITVDVAMNESGKEPLQRLVDLGAEGHFAMVGVEPITIADESVDVAFAGDVIEHLPNSPKWFLEEILRVLKPGGWVVLSTPNAVRLTVRLKVLAGYSNWPPVTDFIENARHVRHHMGHHKEYTAEELRFVLQHVGMTDVKIEFVEDTLRRRGIFRSFRDIRTQDRLFSDYWSNRGRHWLNPFELLRLGLVLCVACCPRLRSTLLVSAVKPVGLGQ